MSKFTKFNNPSKRKARRKKDYTERSINAVKEMLIDSKLGYSISTEYYNQKAEGKKS